MQGSGYVCNNRIDRGMFIPPCKERSRLPQRRALHIPLSGPGPGPGPVPITLRRFHGDILTETRAVLRDFFGRQDAVDESSAPGAVEDRVDA